MLRSNAVRKSSLFFKENSSIFHLFVITHRVLHYITYSNRIIHLVTKLRADAGSLSAPLNFVTQIKRVEPQSLFFPPQLQVPQFLLPQLYRKTCALFVSYSTAQRSNADNSGNERYNSK